ncbi:hypothetical protein HQ590_03880 [bacterium]|nr:hypothetical protein [bacterium]
MSIPPAQNLERLLSGEPGAWLPFTLDVGAIPGLTAPVQRRFETETGQTDPAEYFNYDFRVVSLSARFGGTDPQRFHTGVDLPAGTTFDEWAVGHWSGGGEGTVDESYPPLARAETVADIEALPDPVIEPLAGAERVRAYQARGYPVFGYAGSVYEWSWWIRGMEEFLVDLLSRRALAEALIGKVQRHTEQLALASAAAGIDVLCFYDDAGMQTGMQLAPELWRETIKPAWRAILESVRRHHPGARTFLHCCGDIRPILPDIVDLGFDILHPLQPECIDFAAAHREYGRHLLLCATLSSQKVFPFGSPADVRREVQRLRAICGPDKRGILCPSNLVQPETPWENIVAFADEAGRGGAARPCEIPRLRSG